MIFVVMRTLKSPGFMNLSEFDMSYFKNGTLFLLLLTCGLFFLPFIFWPDAQIAFEIPRVIFVHRWIEILVTLGALTLFSTSSNKIRIESLAALLLFIIFAIGSSWFGADWAKSVSGNTYRADGLLTLLRLASLSVIIGLTWQNRFIIPLTTAIASSSILVSLGTIATIISPLFNISIFPPWEGAYGFTFGQPEFLAGYLVMTLPCIYYLYVVSKNRYRKLLIAGIVYQWLALFITQSWGAVLTAVFTSILAVIVTQPWQKKTKTYLVSGVIVLLLVIGTVIAVSKEQHPMSMTAESRQRIFTKVLLGFEKKPLFGWGWANIDYAFNAVDWPYHFSQDVYVDKAHSQFLEVLVTTGIAGFASYLLLLILTLRSLIGLADKKDNWWCGMVLMVFVNYLIHSQTNVIGIAEEIFFWLLVGICLQKEKAVNAKKAAGG